MPGIEFPYSSVDEAVKTFKYDFILNIYLNKFNEICLFNSHVVHMKITDLI